MYISDLDSHHECLLKDVVCENLKILGVRCRLPKKSKDEKEVLCPENQTFQKPLHLLKKCTVSRINGCDVEIPEFLADACDVIEKDIKTEGIFRRAGSTCKQRESKLALNSGRRLTYNQHVFDVCNLVKLFFRELPQPLIPFTCHEMFVKCLLLLSREKQVEALMLACLLVPMENLSTLAFFMELLLKVSQHSDKNKMDVKNLAIILTPTLMPVDEGGRTPNSLKLTNHFKVLELLIENAEKIGEIPEHVEECIFSTDKKTKRKQRSGSITRMFSGLKKIVANRGSTTPEWDDSSASTPGSISSLGKRKAVEVSGSGISAKRKKYLTDLLPDSNLLATPLKCRMNGYTAPVSALSIPSPMPANLKRSTVQSPPRKSQKKLFSSRSSAESDLGDDRCKRISIVRRRTTKKQKSSGKLSSASSSGSLFTYNAQKNSTDRVQAKLSSASSSNSLFTYGSQKTSLERKLSMISWGRKKNSLYNKSIDESSESTIDLSGEELMTVPKSEYEEIKNRVSALEEELEMMNAAHSVQTAYEKTLEESERINEGSTEQLARRLSKELKIRRSQENKVIRSPSARKIGSLRRRSKEMVQKMPEPKANLKRGRPNTLQTGLPSPGTLRTMSNVDLSSSKLDSPRRSSSFQERSEWKSGDTFFAREHILKKLLPSPQGRPSIAEIRYHNAGMVLEKAKLFNSLNQSGESDRSVKLPRRQSSRLENVKRLFENEKSPKKVEVTRSRSVQTGKKSKRIVSEAKENEARSFLQSEDIAQDLKEVIHQVCTPLSQKLLATPIKENIRITALKSQTPTIKKCLGPTSPRNFVKTPASQARSTSRPRPTPLRALAEPFGTPHRGLRRSPRILARSASSGTRL